MPPGPYHVTRFPGLYRLLLGGDLAWSLHGVVVESGGSRLVAGDAVRIYSLIYGEGAFTLGEASRVDVEEVTGYPLVTASRPGFNGRYQLGVFDANTGLFKMLECDTTCSSYIVDFGVPPYDVVRFGSVYVVVDTDANLYVYVNGSLSRLGTAPEARGVYSDGYVYVAGDYVWRVSQDGTVEKVVDTAGVYIICMVDGDVVAVDTNSGRVYNLSTGSTHTLPSNVTAPDGGSVNVTQACDCGSVYEGEVKPVIVYRYRDGYIAAVMSGDYSSVEEWLEVEGDWLFAYVEPVYRCVGSTCTDTGVVVALP